jgi:hypothetical protein
MDYTIIKFDEATAQVVLRFGDGRAYPDVAVDLPVDDSGNVPTGDELTTYLSGFVPTYYVERAATIKEHGIPNKEDVTSLVTDAPEVIFQDEADKASYYKQDRNDLLSNSDWAVLPDSPLSEKEVIAWKEYRQFLRDMPQQAQWPDVRKTMQAPNMLMAHGSAETNTLGQDYIKKYMPENPTKYLEVGVESAATLVHIAEHFDSLVAANGVDPYVGFENTLSAPDGEIQVFTTSTMSLWKDKANALIANSSATDKITLDFNSGIEALSSHTDSSYDLIFIDTAMDADEHKQEIKGYWDKLKSNGVICGFKYDEPKVKTVVDEAITELAGSVNQDDSFWYVIKS